ncbi:MAG: phosphatidate cytidylyltransferase [Chitinophagales bacterium]|nr:phosphatidate cytidylyltransferase [Chitinophagales bacterium]MDW8419998.1 phosphatidate cytidylyltransferase [Chitinophagales bacterium]
MNFKNLITRALSGAVFVLVMVAGTMYHPLTYLLVMCVVLAGALGEYLKITAAMRGVKHRRWPVILISLVLFLISFQLNRPPVGALPGDADLLDTMWYLFAMQRDKNLDLTVLLPCVFFLLIGIQIFRIADNPFQHIGYSFLGIMWVCVPLMLTNHLYFDTDAGPVFVVTLFALIWLHDTACYLTGSLIGRHKLLERISPGKTIEGTAGGFVLTPLAGYFVNDLYRFFGASELFSAGVWVVIAVVVSATATVGDLAESMLKRKFQIKDSGSFMPGHGGFLDRFDAYFFTVPFVTLLLWILRQSENVGALIDFVK